MFLRFALGVAGVAIATTIALAETGPAPAQTPPAATTPPATTAPSDEPFGEDTTLTAKTIVYIKGNGTWDTAFQTITGSFNFTKAAEDQNAENLLILHDRPGAIAAYEANFEHHLGHSVPFVTAMQ